MKPSLPCRFLLVLAAVAAVGIPCQAQTVIYSDSFDGTNEAIVRGTTPTISLTNAAYFGATRGSAQVVFDTSAGNPAGSAITSFNGSVALSLASAGTFTRAAGQIFTISADLSVNTITGSGGISNPQVNGTGNGDSTRGAGLGFYSNFADGVTSQDPFSTYYTGFNLQNAGSDTAALQFVKNGVSTGFASLSVLPGTFSTANFYNLSYTVDTSTGNLLSLSFNGVDLTSTFAASATGAFTEANTAFAGFGGSSSTVASGARVDNFAVTAVPEPTTLALIGGAALLLVLFRRRPRQSA